MLLRTLKRIVYVCLALALMAIAWVLVKLYRPAAPQRENLPDSALVGYMSEWNYRQGRNECGPYAAAAAMRALRGDDVNSAIIAAHTPWRLRVT